MICLPSCLIQLLNVVSRERILCSVKIHPIKRGVQMAWSHNAIKRVYATFENEINPRNGRNMFALAFNLANMFWVTSALKKSVNSFTDSAAYFKTNPALKIHASLQYNLDFSNEWIRISVVEILEDVYKISANRGSI